MNSLIFNYTNITVSFECADNQHLHNICTKRGTDIDSGMNAMNVDATVWTTDWKWDSHMTTVSWLL